jgi:hypothetical protein
MKRFVCLSSFVLVLSLSVARAADVVYWNFESPNIPPTTSASNVVGILPAFGSGSASSLHRLTANFSSPTGNGSTHSWTADTWLPNDYWQFQFSTTGYGSLALNWDQVSDLTGPTNFVVSVSTDGSAFSNVGTVIVKQNTAGNGGVWNSTTSIPNYHYALDLSSLTGLNNQANVYVRLTASFAGLSFSSDNRIDNFDVSGAVVPEPGSLALLGFAGLTFGWQSFRNRSRGGSKRRSPQPR